MKLRRRRSRFPRFDWRKRIDTSEPLKGQLWTRSEKALKEPDVHWAFRAGASALAVLECTLLAWLVYGPALAIRDVEVAGAAHLTAAQVLHAAGLDEPASVLTVDVQADERRLLGQAWIRTATVQPMLDGTVVVDITEWKPVAVYHAGAAGKLMLLSDQAVVLGPAPSPEGLLTVQGPSGPDLRSGDRALDPALLVALINIQRGFPGFLGQQVASFALDSCGDLTLVSARGWKVFFGRVITPEEFDSLRGKLAALKAIAGSINYNSTDLEYVNVMNASEPAAGFKSKEPPAPSPTPGAPSPSTSPVPTCA